MLSHVSLGVADLERAGGFYDAVLEPLGIVRVWQTPRGIGYGPPGGNDRLALKLAHTNERLAAGPGFHLAFSAERRDVVDRFHEAAMKHGGVDEGGPGLRPHYGPTYYAAFVRDLDGHKLEVVHQQQQRVVPAGSCHEGA